MFLILHKIYICDPRDKAEINRNDQIKWTWPWGCWPADTNGSWPNLIIKYPTDKYFESHTFLTEVNWLVMNMINYIYIYPIFTRSQLHSQIGNWISRCCVSFGIIN